MNEEESKKALFDLNYEYMQHSPKERLKLYDDYIKKRAEIRNALREFVCVKTETEKKL